ncbi:ABC transporter ATP-binding protein [Candidatus Hepatobacter penaei]|uniref:ABC transporter ATP-binding protein n=1 Tax=Candidatus Hepatobacter penaei TaxID=1274402 RepID=UPI000697BBF0|nr:ABC transporter ATP-binding protein [Candidatus Hepatobacter penaei]
MMKKTSSLLRKGDGWAIVRRFWKHFLSSHVGNLLVSLAFMGVVSLSTMLLANLVRPIFDDIFLARNQKRLWSLGILILILFLVKGVAAFGHSFSLARLGQKVSAAFQQALFRRLIYADHQVFSRYTSGKLLSLFAYDTQVVFRGMTQTLTSLVRDSLTLICLVGLMFYQDWFLSLLACVVFPLATYLSLSLGRRMRYFSHQSQSAMAKLHAFWQEIFQGIDIIKAYTMEKVELTKAQEKIGAFVRFNLKNARMKGFLHPLMETIVGFGVVAVVLYGGYHVVSGQRSPGELMSFVTALLMAYEPLKKLSHLNSYFQESLAALSRLFALYDQPQTIRDARDAQPLRLDKGAVHFRDITFSYGRRPVFKNFSCHMKGGARLALVGASGAGKSTLLHLMLRFYDTEKGSIEIDGQNVRDVTLASLRENMAFVSQHVTLFDDTISNNIAYGCPGAGLDKIQEAARHAYAHDFIMQLPQGYETSVGERGAALSGGQRQRIAIARALLKDAPILLLDEATSALDAQSELFVQKALERLMTGRTTLVIAHRMSTVEKADYIYVLDEGKLVAQGAHKELASRPGPYRDMVLPTLSSKQREERAS